MSSDLHRNGRMSRSAGTMKHLLALEVGETDAGRVRVRISGELDFASAPQVLDVVGRVHAEYEPARIELDLGQVRFLDSEGIRALLLASERLTHRGCGLLVTDAQPQVLRVLELTGVADRLAGCAQRRAI